MSANGLSVSRLVNVTVSLTPPLAQAPSFNSCLILGTSNVIDVSTRKREYNTIDEVAVDFGSTTEEYLSAVLWFEQSPQPNTLSIGRWAKTATAGQLFGATLQGTALLLPTWTAISNGAFLAIEDGVAFNVSGLNFAAQTNMNGVAGVIQTAIAAIQAGTTVKWNASYDRFELASGTTGASSSFNFLQTSTAVGKAAFTGQPTAANTLTIAGTAITFVSSNPTGNQVLIGADVPGTVANLLAFLNASTDANITKLTYFATGNTIYMLSVLTGTAGNAYTLTTTAANITVTAPTGGVAGTDISGTMGATSTSSGAYVANGIAAESALAAVQIFDDRFSSQWYGLLIPGASDADVVAVASYVEAANPPHFYGVSTQEAGCLVTGDQTNIAYQLQQLKLNHTFVQYSSTNKYSATSALARILTTNWLGNNTTITLMYKQEPGIVAETITATQADALEACNCNVFVNYNNDTAILQFGACSSGQFADSIIGCDWLRATVQNNLYNLLYGTNTKIPQTDAGMHTLSTGIEAACVQGVNNQLIAPGQWNAGGFGNLSQGDYLPKGYYIYCPPVSTQAESDRAARKSVPFQVAVKLAGAVHTVDVAISVNP